MAKIAMAKPTKEEFRKIDSRLCAAIKRYPQLYDKSSEDYKLNNNEIWEAISAELQAYEINFPPASCVQRWTALRNRFCKERSKLSRKPGSPLSSWPLFSSLMFFDPFVPKRRHVNEETVAVADDDGDGDGDTELVEEEYTLYDHNGTEVSFVDPMIKKRKFDESGEGDRYLKTALKTATELLDHKYKATAAPQKDDAEINAFCDSLYYELIKVPDVRRSKCKLAILDLCMQYQA